MTEPTYTADECRDIALAAIEAARGAVLREAETFAVANSIALSRKDAREATAAAEQRLRERIEALRGQTSRDERYDLGWDDALIEVLRPDSLAAPASPRQGEPVEGLRDALERREALERLRDLDDKHFPTTRAKRPGWEVCDRDSMTWPCDTQKALDALEVIWPEIVEAKLAAALSEPAEAGEP